MTGPPKKRSARRFAPRRRLRQIPTPAQPRLWTLGRAPSHNLPVQVTSFIGREREIAEVKRLLSDTHLLTLTGAGGCGKSRLALQVASELLKDYVDGVWLAQLASLSDPALVPQTVSSRLSGGKRADALTPREREVAALVAHGRTNREIAAALVVSERTADAHVQNILNKLGFSSRAQIAAWATERGLRINLGA